jgi:hypothetical protein
MRFLAYALSLLVFFASMTAKGEPSLARGMVVVAAPEASTLAWPLARAVYASPILRPFSLDDATARVLAGEAPGAKGDAAQRELWDLASGVRGDDARSRACLALIARKLNVRAIVVVEAASARIFVAESERFDPAVYPSTDRTWPTWPDVVHSLEARFGARDVPMVRTDPAPSRAFYQSGWFWGAVGTAALLGGAIFLATRDPGSTGTVGLRLQVPR